MIEVADAGFTVPDAAGRQQPVTAVRISGTAVSMDLLSLGAAITSVEVPDLHGERGPVHLSLPRASDYADHHLNPHLGSSIGRYANRIAGASFELDGRRYELSANNGPNTLHGGAMGWDRHVWDLLDTAADQSGGTAVFGLTSVDGDQGFPGTVDATATYTVHDDVLTIEYSARTDAPTVITMTNHGYWNLDGDGTIAEHRVTLAADEYLAVDDSGIPTDGLLDVAGTAFDLRSPTRLGDAMAQVAGGFDHCFAVRGEAGELRDAAVLEAPRTGRWLSVRTDQRGVQLYTGNNLGDPFLVHGSVSLETQAFPDSPNRHALGSVRLEPGEQYSARSEYRFGTGEAPAVLVAGTR